MDINLLVTLGHPPAIGDCRQPADPAGGADHLAAASGPEYERTVERMGGRGKAEADLAAREKRVQKLEIVPLAPRTRSASAWSGRRCSRASSTARARR